MMTVTVIPGIGCGMDRTRSREFTELIDRSLGRNRNVYFKYLIHFVGSRTRYEFVDIVDKGWVCPYCLSEEIECWDESGVVHANCKNPECPRWGINGSGSRGGCFHICQDAIHEIPALKWVDIRFQISVWYDGINENRGINPEEEEEYTLLEYLQSYMSLYDITPFKGDASVESLVEYYTEALKSVFGFYGDLYWTLCHLPGGEGLVRFWLNNQ